METMERSLDEKTENKLEEIMDAVLEKLGPGYKMFVVKTQKTNGIVLTGLAIDDGSGNGAPAIYLMDEDMEKPLCDIVDSVISEYKEKRSFDASSFTRKITDKEYAFSHAVYKVVGTEANRKMLEIVPHKELLDMSVIYLIAGEVNGRMCSFKIDHGFLKRLGVTVEELDRYARINTIELGIFFERLDEILEPGMIRGSASIEDCDFDVDIPAFVLTNKSLFCGASLFAFPDVFSKIAEKAGSDLLVIPSSVHEVIVVVDNGMVDIDVVRRLVHTVNRTKLSPDEVLTDSVYRYSRATGNLGIA